MEKSDAAPIIVFDVNETLLDITALEPLFDRRFGDAAMLRIWFAELILYSQTMTLSGLYAPFGELAAGTLVMVGSNHDIAVSDADIAELKERLGNMPAHPDVVPALTRLRDAGFRLVKPAPETYQYVARELGVETTDMRMVACHLWDIIGAQAAGCKGAFVTRPNNAILPAEGLSAPDIVVRDLGELADQLAAPS